MYARNRASTCCAGVSAGCQCTVMVFGRDEFQRTVEVGESAMVARALLCASHAVGLME